MKSKICLTALFLLALFPRVSFLDRVNLIDDQRRDYRQAIGLVRGQEVPLLGIPSSVPRFSQGPLNIWFSALAFMLGGANPISPVILAGIVTSFGVVFFFRFLRSHLPEHIALIAALIWALSPGAIIQSRLPFYLFAEPIFLLLFLASLLRLKSKSPKSIFHSVFLFFLLFQWELATIPLIVLLPVAFWHYKIRVNSRVIAVSVLGTLIGLLPQLLYDLTHQCRQLCGFALWAVYRLAATTGFDGRHSLTVFQTEFWQSIYSQLLRLVGLGSPLVLIVVAGLVVLSLYHVMQNRRAPELLLFSLAGFVALFLGLIVHGEPSEAYFPPFIILLPIIAGYGLKYIESIRKNLHADK